MYIICMGVIYMFLLLYIYIFAVYYSVLFLHSFIGYISICSIYNVANKYICCK